MANSDNKINYGTTSDCIIKSIGVCVATPESKKQPPCVFVAYTMSATGNDVRIIPMKLPKKPYTEKDFLSAICQAENTKRVTYIDFNGEQKDIYVCRESSGKIIDIVERDFEKNAFSRGFAEILSSHLKFSTSEPKAIKFNEIMDAEVVYGSSEEYERGGYRYAIVNAYNACLLGRVFSREQLQLETKNAQRAKYEVRNMTSTKYIDELSINVRPIYIEPDGIVNHYITEQISIIDGTDESTRIYKISYTNRLNDYNIVRQ